MSTESKTQPHIQYSDFTPRNRQVQVGTSLCERFRVEELIGLGGMGAVFRMHDESDGIEKAMKICLSPSEDRRFDREVRNMRKVNHPNVVPVLDSGLCDEQEVIETNVATSTEPPRMIGSAKKKWQFPYFIMPLATKSLADKLPNIIGNATTVLGILSQVVDGLTAIHDAGMVHRDIKPQNVLQIEDRWCVADLGLSVLASRETTALTQSGQFLGTYKYAAPEQFADAKHSTIQTDVFQLGKLLFEMFTGEDPAMPFTNGCLFGETITRALQLRPEDRFAAPRLMMDNAFSEKARRSPMPPLPQERPILMKAGSQVRG